MTLANLAANVETRAAAAEAVCNCCGSGKDEDLDCRRYACITLTWPQPRYAGAAGCSWSSTHDTTNG